MSKISLKALSLAYTLLVVLTASVLSALPYTIMSIALAIVVLLASLRPLPLRFNILISLAVIFLAPLALESLLLRFAALPTAASQALATITALPVYYRLDTDLKEYARTTSITAASKDERRITTTARALLIAGLTAILIAPLVGRLVLLLSGACLLSYLLGELIWISLRVPRPTLAAETAEKRIIVGTKGSAALRLNSRADITLRVFLQPASPWVKVNPADVIVRKGLSQLVLHFTPPLAGLSRPRLQAAATDMRGLIRITQTLEPLQLQIIPRAKYAEWLATKYLEQTSRGVVSEVKFPRTFSIPKRGTEYSASREYVPGDALRDIDWKHTLKLSQLIVREYRETGEQAAIIAVNLAVADDEEADKLVFNLITAALTMARENIPTALAAYNFKDVVLSRGIVEPLEMVRQALALVKEIGVVQFSDCYLEPIDVARIKRNINLLKQTKSEPGRKLMDIFNFERRSVEEAARHHPATLALTAAAAQVPAPAMILVVSQLNHDAEALLVTGEKLARRKYTTLPVAVV